MSDIAKLIADLVAAEVSAELVGRVAAALASRETVVVKVGDEAAERRRASDRQRKADLRLRKSAEVVGSPEPESPAPSPPRDIINPPYPSPSSSLRSDEPRDKRASIAKDAAIAFERFWEAWPNKVAKRDAAKAFLKVAGEIDAILAGVAAYMASKPPDRAWMHPATFLNGRRWEDAPAPTPMARAGPAFRDNRNGPGYLAAEIFGLGENGRHEANPSENVPALPFAGDGEPRANGRDDGGVSGNPAELLIANSLRRM